MEENISWSERAVKDIASGVIRPSVPFSLKGDSLVLDHGGVNSFIKTPAKISLKDDITHEGKSLQCIKENQERLLHIHPVRVKYL
jgi:hypothetical protein